MIYIVCATGWILAAFLGGILIGRVRDAPAPKKPKTGNQEPMSADEKQAAEKAQREWQNFLNYDGTAQEPIK